MVKTRAVTCNPPKLAQAFEDNATVGNLILYYPGREVLHENIVFDGMIMAEIGNTAIVLFESEMAHNKRFKSNTIDGTMETEAQSILDNHVA